MRNGAGTHLAAGRLLGDGADHMLSWTPNDRRSARHRRRGAGLLLLDYPERDGMFRRPTGVMVRRPPGRRFPGRTPTGRRLHDGNARSRARVAPRVRVLLAMAAATVALSAVAVGPALLRPLGGGIGASGHRAPRIDMPLPAFPAFDAGASGVTSARLRQTRLMPSAAPARHVMPRVSPSAAPPSAAPPSAAPPSAAPPSAVSPSPVVTSSAAARPRQAVVVRYTAGAQSAGGFQGEVDVGNNGSAPLSGWQIVVALPHDEIISFQGASGYVSHHILLLQPPSSAPAIAPGTTLRVLFAAQGTETTPEVCAFNDIACG